MKVTVVALLLCSALLAAMLICLEMGRRSGKRRIKKDPDGGDTGTHSIEAAVYGLLGLLLAFTITGAASRYDHRRDLTVEETNAISNAYRRLDLLPPDVREILRDRFRNYLDSRIAFYKGIQDYSFALTKLAEQDLLEREIWDRAIASAEQSERSGSLSKLLLLPALNTMFEIRTTRTGSLFMHPPVVIYFLLIGLALASSFLAGYEMSKDPQRNWVFAIIFTTILSVSVYIIVDLEFPRYGLITEASFDSLLVDLRANMND